VNSFKVLNIMLELRYILSLSHCVQGPKGPGVSIHKLGKIFVKRKFEVVVKAESYLSSSFPTIDANIPSYAVSVSMTSRMANIGAPQNHAAPSVVNTQQYWS
jgi:hypothetical protein